MLRTSPVDFVTFDSDGTNESRFAIKSIAKIPVSYKIQTTSPEKFLVRPRLGVLSPGETVNISIYLKFEHSLSENGKDKFLIMGMPVGTTDISIAEIAELWKMKTTSSLDVEQHRLVCQYSADIFDKMDTTQAAAATTAYASSNKLAMDKESQTSINQVSQRIEKLEKRVKCLQYVIFAFIFLLIIGLGYLLYQQFPSAKSDGNITADVAKSNKFVDCRHHVHKYAIRYEN